MIYLNIYLLMGLTISVIGIITILIKKATFTKYIKIGIVLTPLVWLPAVMYIYYVNKKYSIK
jgi:uncharacterized membrane protein YqaE (UPF0057 family)